MTNFDFEIPRTTVLIKRPKSENQRKKTISVDLYEFVALVQGGYKTIEIYNQSNQLKKTIDRETLLSKSVITPFVDHIAGRAFYIIDYSTAE